MKFEVYEDIGDNNLRRLGKMTIYEIAGLKRPRRILFHVPRPRYVGLLTRSALSRYLR